MDCYFYQYIPTEAKTPSPDEINKLQRAPQRCAMLRLLPSIEKILSVFGTLDWW